MNVTMKDMPHFVKKEVEKLEETIQPMKKKVARYSFWSFPLIAFSVFNLFILLFGMPEIHMTSVVIYAVIGAVGMALSKEVKYRRKEMMKVSTDYMVERIKQSDVVSTSIKEKYTVLVQNQPFRSIVYFVEFLEEENRTKRVSYF